MFAETGGNSECVTIKPNLGNAGERVRMRLCLAIVLSFVFKHKVMKQIKEKSFLFVQSIQIN